MPSDDQKPKNQSKSRPTWKKGPTRPATRPGSHSAKQQPAPRSSPGHARPSHPDNVLIYGLHAVRAALSNPKRKSHALTLTQNAARRLAEGLEGELPPHEIVATKKFDHLLGADTVHQGALLETTQLPEPSLEDIAEAASAPNGGPILLLDQITDPHNVGAILRSAAVFGVSGVVMTWRHSPPLDATLAKTASGALELTPILRVQNLSRTLEDLKQQNFTVLGLEGRTECALEDEAFDGPTALVLGAEGKGLRQKTAETCTRLCRIEAAGDLASLNVSNAAAVALHLVALRRR